MSTMITDYRKSDGSRVQLDKLEESSDGWNEYAEPLTHGMAGNRVRRFFKNDTLGFHVNIEEVSPVNLFKKDYMIVFATYISPSGKICFTSPDGGCFNGTEGIERDDYVFFCPPTAGIDPEFDGVLKEVFDGEDHSDGFHKLDDLIGKDRPKAKKTEDVLFDCYGVWNVGVVVQSYEGAFHIAEFIGKRAQLRDNVRKAVSE